MIFVYDVTDRESFEKIPNSIKLTYEHIEKDKMSILLIGNKIDLEEKRKVSFLEGQDFAKQNNFQFIETSAKENLNKQI